jgi:hypothetical protein
MDGFPERSFSEVGVAHFNSGQGESISAECFVRGGLEGYGADG